MTSTFNRGVYLFSQLSPSFSRFQYQRIFTYFKQNQHPLSILYSYLNHFEFLQVSTNNRWTTHSQNTSHATCVFLARHQTRTGGERKEYLFWCSSKSTVDDTVVSLINLRVLWGKLNSFWVGRNEVHLGSSIRYCPLSTVETFNLCFPDMEMSQ